MSCHPRVTAWTTIRRAHGPHLPPSPAPVLALWRLGRVWARSWALTAVRMCLATWLPRKEDAVRPQWRACGSAATAQGGTARPARGVETGCGPWLAGGVGQWEGTPWALALAATTLGPRLTGLARRVVSRGWAIPVAWTLLAAPATHAWRRAWGRRGHRALPGAWTVLGLADRGLDARWRWRRLTRLGWPPLWRLNTGGTFRPTGQGRGGPLQTLGPEPGTPWQGPGSAGTGRHRQQPCARLACWDAGDTDPWWLRTARPPEASTAGW
jgi:hypothetical protein